MHSNGNSFACGGDRSAYPEPWYVRLLGPVQPGAMRP